MKKKPWQQIRNTFGGRVLGLRNNIDEALRNPEVTNCLTAVEINKLTLARHELSSFLINYKNRHKESKKRYSEWKP